MPLWLQRAPLELGRVLEFAFFHDLSVWLIWRAISHFSQSDNLISIQFSILLKVWFGLVSTAVRNMTWFIRASVTDTDWKVRGRGSRTGSCKTLSASGSEQGSVPKARTEGIEKNFSLSPQKYYWLCVCTCSHVPAVWVPLDVSIFNYNRCLSKIF